MNRSMPWCSRMSSRSRRSLRRDDRALGVGRADDAGVEARDGRPAVGVPQRRERRDHAAARRSAAATTRSSASRPPSSAGRARGRRSPCRRPRPQGRPRMSRLPPSMSAASASRSSGPEVEQRVEGAAARLLLALDEVPDAAGQRTDRLEPRLDRPDARQELALVVRGAAGPDAAVADGGLVRRRRPQLERARRAARRSAGRRSRCAARRRSRRRRAAARRRPRAPRPSRRAAGAAPRSSRRRRGAPATSPPSDGIAQVLDELLRSSARGAPRRGGRTRRSRPTRPSRRSRALAVEVEERQLDDRGVDPAAAALDRPLDLQPGADPLVARRRPRRARSPA